MEPAGGWGSTRNCFLGGNASTTGFPAPLGTPASTSHTAGVSSSLFQASTSEVSAISNLSLGFCCPSFWNMNLLGVTKGSQRELPSGAPVRWISCATDMMKMPDFLDLRMWDIQSQTKSMCVGRQLGSQACQNQGEGERERPLISPPHRPPFLIPGPNSRPARLQGRGKKWEHGTMPHVRDVRKPKHSSALVYLIWFIKCNLQFLWNPLLVLKEKTQGLS